MRTSVVRWSADGISPANRDGEPVSFEPSRTASARHGNCPSCGALHGRVVDCGVRRAGAARRPAASPARRPVAAPARSTWTPPREPLPAGARSSNEAARRHVPVLTPAAQRAAIARARAHVAKVREAAKVSDLAALGAWRDRLAR
jgi:hypothetical protein